MPDELWQLPATVLDQMLTDRLILPSEILASVHARMREHEEKVHAFITRTDDLAEQEAAAADERTKSGRRISAIDGIPYSIKDLDATAGIRTTMGSRFFEDNVPDTDGATAAKLRSSGGVLLGKTNTPHFGYKDMCDNLVAETTVNPWDLTRTPGASSGGAAAAVAAGFGPLAQGGDGAGSIRIPAALCGVVGFKPTKGRISMWPYREYWTHRTHNGPLARTVADAAMMLSIMSGYDERDPGTIPAPLEEFRALPNIARPLDGVRVRWSPDFGYGPIEPEIHQIVETAVAVLRDLGATVEAKDPGWEDVSADHRVIYTTQIANGIGSAVAGNPDWVEPTLQGLIDAGREYSAVDLRRAEVARGTLYDKTVEMFREVDFFVSPTMPLEAWPATPGRGTTVIDGTDTFGTYGRSYLLNPFNLTGQPAISIPCGFSVNGLPVGIQIAGPLHRDIAVLQVAQALEQRLDLTGRWPAL